ncbi:MAG: redoxin domain-containing protein [Hyphomicrobiales bacterium]
MTNAKPRVGAIIDKLSLARVDGEGSITLGVPTGRWTILFVYRGKHCPRCKKYLNKLSHALPQWSEAMDVVVVSADTKEKALADQAEFGWKFDLCYGLTEPQMRSLGLYVSDPLSDAETTTRFAEPGTFALRPDGSLMLVDISNGPASRPDLEELLDGMKFNIDNDRPVRGTA